MVKLEVCIDSLESAINAIHGGADELEVCSSLAEGGLTPSVGLVNQILCLVKKIGTGVLMHHSCSECKCPELTEKPSVNIMIRCRAGSDFYYTATEVETMLTDLAVMKNMGVDRFVFGALTATQDIDKELCAKVISKANPLPVTFHRAFDVCQNTLISLETIIDLGFDRLLTSGQRPSVEDPGAYKLISELMAFYKDKIQIMPGAGINVNNVQQYVVLGCPIIHCSCKTFRVPTIQRTLNMGTEIASSEKIYYTDQNSVIRLRCAIKNEITRIQAINDDLYLATGCYFADLHYAYRLGKSTVIEIVQKSCDVIWKKLKNIVMQEPTKEKFEEISKGFEKYTNFPNCIGAIDGKHIRIIKPVESGSLYYNYKNFHSTVLLAVCDANYCFISVDIGAYGKSNDSTIFKNSVFYKKLVEKSLNIPDPKPISMIDTTPLPHVIVGDEAFSLMENVMRPYCGKSLTNKKRIFNYRLSRARRYIECCFGILVNKWRIFHRPLNVHIDFAEKIIKNK